MAGRGPAPKPKDRRARGSSRDKVETTVVTFEPGKQPSLPSRMPDGNAWPARTRAWWKMWAASPLSNDFSDNDWSELLDTAVLHGLFWTGTSKVAAELRLRVAKFGATPEDRARLRIQFAQADEADAKRPTGGTSSRTKYGTLHALPTPAAAGE